MLDNEEENIREENENGFRQYKIWWSYSQEFKKCEFCGKELRPLGLDYLYANISPDVIKYERCDCNKAQEYWNKIDEQEYEKEKRKHFRDIINKIYKQNHVRRKFQEQNFENFNINSENEIAVEVARDYTNKSIAKMQSEGMIITELENTHLAASIANKLIENDKIVLMGRLTMLLDMIKETFRDNTKSENELIELYSNVDMIIIEDFGTEKERFSQSQDEQLVDESKLYQTCYEITLKNIKEKELV